VQKSLAEYLSFSVGEVLEEVLSLPGGRIHYITKGEIQMKRTLSLFTALVLAGCLFTACSSNSGTSDPGGPSDNAPPAEAASEAGDSPASSDKTYKIAMIYQDLSTEFNIYFQDVLTARSKELGIELIEFDGQGETDRQLNQCENAIEQKVDLLMFIPQDKSGCAPIIDNCIAAGIPVIGCNNITDNIDQATAYVGANDIEAGIMEMEHMAGLLDGKGSICIIQGPYGHSAQLARQEGIEQTLKNYPDINVLYENTANWNRTEAMNLMENWIQKDGPNINAVVCHSDDMGMGALQAIQGAGLQDQIKVIGVDAILDALNSVKAGEMSATVFQDVYGQAEGAMDVAVKILNDEPYEKTTYVPFKLVTQENVDEFLANFSK